MARRPVIPAGLVIGALVALCGCSAPGSGQREQVAPSAPAPSRVAPAPSASPSSSAVELVGADQVLGALGIEDWQAGPPALEVVAPEPPPGWSALDVADLLGADRAQFTASHLDPSLWALEPDRAHAVYREGLDPFYLQFAPEQLAPDVADRVVSMTVFEASVRAAQPFLHPAAQAVVDEQGRLWVRLWATSVQPVLTGDGAAVAIAVRSVAFAKNRSGPVDDPGALYWADASARWVSMDCATFEVGALVPKTTAYSRAAVEDMRAIIRNADHPWDESTVTSGLGAEQCAPASQA